MYMKVQRMHLAYQKFKCFFKEDIFWPHVTCIELREVGSEMININESRDEKEY
jgi:hypothetical protein